jgi:hypothetical protein
MIEFIIIVLALAIAGWSVYRKLNGLPIVPKRKK